MTIRNRWRRLSLTTAAIIGALTLSAQAISPVELSRVMDDGTLEPADPWNLCHDSGTYKFRATATLLLDDGDTPLVESVHWKVTMDSTVLYDEHNVDSFIEFDVPTDTADSFTLTATCTNDSDSTDSDNDSGTVNIIKVDILSVPQYLFASAEHATPIKFKIQGLGSSPLIDSITAKFYLGGVEKASYNIAGRFVANDGPDQNNGTSNEYTCFVHHSAYSGVTIPNNRHSLEASFRLFVDAKENSTSAVISLESDVDDTDAAPNFFGDKTLLAIEANPTTGKIYTVPVTSEPAQIEACMRDGEGGYRHYKERSVYPCGLTPHDCTAAHLLSEGYDDVGHSGSISSTSITAKSHLEDDFDINPSFGDHDDGALSRHYGVRRGGFFYMSYGGKVINVLPPGEYAMDLSKVSSNYMWTLFGSGKVECINEQKSSGSVEFDGGKVATAFLSWALAGTPFSTAYKTVTFVFSLVRVNETDSISDANRSTGTIDCYLTQTTPGGTTGYEAVFAPWEWNSDGSYLATSSGADRPASVTGKTAGVGHQMTMRVTVNSVSKGLTLSSGFWGYEGIRISSECSYVTDSSDGQQMELTCYP